MESATRKCLDDGFLVCTDDVPKWEEPNDRTNRTGIRTLRGNVDLDWPVKHPEAIKVSLCLPYSNPSRSAICPRQPFFSPDTSTKISRGSSAHDIYKCETIPVFL